MKNTNNKISIEEKSEYCIENNVFFNYLCHIQTFMDKTKIEYIEAI